MYGEGLIILKYKFEFSKIAILQVYEEGDVSFWTWLTSLLAGRLLAKASL